MEKVLCIVIFIVLIGVSFAISFFSNFKKENRPFCSSKNILNKFEPDNTAPKINELIEFDKKNRKKYNIK